MESYRKWLKKKKKNNRMQAKEDLGLIVVKALLRVCAPLIPICLDWKNCVAAASHWFTAAPIV